jgi:hypothetical protein
MAGAETGGRGTTSKEPMSGKIKRLFRYEVSQNPE